MSATTKFPLGFFGGDNPNGNDATAQQAFKDHYDAFVKTMGGAHPVFMDGFTDQGIDPSQWGSNAGWTAWSWAQTGDNYVGPNSGTVPVFGLLMANSAGGWGNVDSFYKQVISGQYDADYKAEIDAWAQQGYKTMEFRIGWEFNGNFMAWAPGNGNASSDADFVTAWQHIADIVHSQSAVDGVAAKTVWNVNATAWSPFDPTALYPGDKYVDIISTDLYSPAYPVDTTNWVSGGSSPDKATWATVPGNLEHYWQYEDGASWNPTPGVGNGNVGWSMQDMVDFAKAHNKPIAMDETGAGSAAAGNGAVGPDDAPQFPQWLAGFLANAQAQGLKVDHANVWDDDAGDVNDRFSNGERPLEAAAWGKYFGAGSGDGSSAGGSSGGGSSGGGVSTPPPPVTIGSGPNKLVLQLSEDAYQGDAQFTVSVDGTQIGGTQTAGASHAAGQSQAFTLLGSFGSGNHTVIVNFLNDAYGGTSSADRNLYVTSATIDGAAIAGGALTEMSGGAQSFSFQGAVPPPPPPPSDVTIGSGPNKLVLQVSEDAYKGDAQFTVSVDGKQIGATQTALASHAAGQSQTFTVLGSFGAGSHTVSVNFLNDAYGGTSSTDRNLYVMSATIDSGSIAGGSLTELQGGARSFGFQGSSATGGGTPTGAASVTFTDSAGHSVTQKVIATGSLDSYQYLTGLQNNVYQWVDTAGVRNIGADGWGQVTTGSLADASGASYALHSFNETDVHLSGATTVAGKTATLTLDQAQRGTIVLGSGNYAVSFTPKNPWGSAADNTVNLTMGSGDDSFVINGTYGLTNAVVHAGSGTDTMSFIGAGPVTAYAGSGKNTITGSANADTFVAGDGSANVTGGGGADTFVYHAAAPGMVTIQDFSAGQGDTVRIDASLKASMHQTAGSSGLMISFGSDTTHGILLKGVSSLPASSLSWA